ARRVIEYFGYVPYRDIDIVETGMRPGERLYEELLTEVEGMTRTSHERLYIAQQERVEYDLVAAVIADLQRAVRISDTEATVSLLQSLVPSFTPGTHLVPDRVPVIHEVEAAARAASPELTPATVSAS
ncbi:MAG: polysaccharide biosynthesis protein, partial [Vulcanimicrobiaceae bacterium]